MKAYPGYFCDIMTPSLQEIDKLPVELIQQFRQTRVSKSIPEYLQRYILHLDKASELFNLKGNITDICKELQLAFPEDDLSFSTAKNRVFNAINFFHLNNTVRNEAWDHYYADRLEALGKKAEDAYDADPAKFSGNIQEARRCYERAHALRTKKDENAVDPELLRPKEFLMNPQHKPSALREAAGIIAQRMMSGEINSVDSLLQGVVSDNKVLQVLVETNVNLTLVQSLEAVEQALDLKEDPPARKEYRTRLRARLEELSPRERVREINRLFDVFDFCLLVGEMPSTDLVPERVGFWQAARDLVKIAREQRSKLKALANGNREMERLVTELRTSDPEIFLTSVDRAGAEEVEVEELEGLLDLDRGFNRGQGIEAYMFTPQTRELMKKMWGLDEVGKRSLWYSRLVGTGIRGGGGLLPFILRAASQDFGAPTEEAALNKALEWVAKEAQVRGYHSPEDVHKMVGFFEPEELGELAQKEICFKVWVEGEDKPREFTLGAKHVLAEMFDADILAELEANKGLGFFGARFARGRLLRRVIWKRMGYSQEDISRWEERERNYKGKAQMLRDQ